MRNQICPSNSTQHVVQIGDTFWRLSQIYGVSIQSIADANPGVDPQNLQIGSTLCIPFVSTPLAPQMGLVTCPKGTFSYTIQSGDTFWRLSQTYGVSVQSIADANPGVDPQNLQIGSTLCIPAAPTPIAPPMQPITCPEGTFLHTIQAGDTYWRLSQTYGVCAQSIAAANPGVDPQNLRIGSTLCIPAAPTSPAPPMRPITCPDGTLSYTIQAGDTYWRLSQAYGVSVQSIADANPGIDPQNLQIGSILCIPAAPTPPALPMQPITCPEGTFPYTIQAGDTFWRLSQTYGVSVQSIADANPGVNPLNLQIGSTLCIPAVQTPSAPPTPPVATPPALPTQPIACPEGTFSYTVQAGDTFWRLSQTYGVSVERIADANPGVNPLNLQIGSTLCIPAVPTPPAPPMQPITCPEGTFSYTVQPGDTYWRLSQTYGVSVQSIADANPGVNPLNLQIGSTLCIPTVPTPPVPTPPVPTPPAPTTPPVAIPPTLPMRPAPLTPPSPTTPPIVPMPPALESEFAYLTKKCDSICGIARKFCVSVESILQMNPWINPKCLHAGTLIYVPINRCGENTFHYAVRAGDTLNRIANRFNVSPVDLITANPNINFRCLDMHQVICIPSA